MLRKYHRLARVVGAVMLCNAAVHGGVYRAEDDISLVKEAHVKSAILAVAIITVCVAGVALEAQSAPDGRLLVLSKADLMLSVIDPATLKVIGRVPSGPDPHEVAASADGRTAYISNYGQVLRKRW